MGIEIRLVLDMTFAGTAEATGWLRDLAFYMEENGAASVKLVHQGQDAGFIQVEDSL